jgi:hypothetical protein
LDLGGTTEPNLENLRRRIDGAAYLRSEGTARLEDFGRLREVAQKFNELNEFIAMSSAQDGLAQTQDFARLEAQLQSARVAYSAAPEGATKERALQRVVELVETRRGLILAAAGMEAVSDWLIDALSLWIDLFIPGRISLRLRPFNDLPDFEVIANLRQDSFLDTDLNQFRLAYGAEPNRPLTVLGLVTSVPERETEDRVAIEGIGGHKTAPQEPVADVGSIDEDTLTDAERRATFERAFRAIFPASEGLERFVRFADFPTVTVQPIAVYRRFAIADQEERSQPSIPDRVKSYFSRTDK